MMEQRRQTDGRETWQRLLRWDKGQAPSERLAAQILISENFKSINPSHPLGGRDGAKDIVCTKDGISYITACYFPRDQQPFSTILKKFVEDSAGIVKNSADGIIFMTNQELTLGERSNLIEQLKNGEQVEIYHLERITTILNSPINFGTRLEFLDIEMTKEEQLSFMAAQQQAMHNTINEFKQLLSSPSQKIDVSVPPVSVSVETDSRYSIHGFNYGGSIHKCTFCKYGFKLAGRQEITSWSFSNPVVMLPITNRYSNPLEIVTPKVVKVEYATCPRCGNKDTLT